MMIIFSIENSIIPHSASHFTRNTSAGAAASSSRARSASQSPPCPRKSRGGMMNESSRRASFPRRFARQARVPALLIPFLALYSYRRGLSILSVPGNRSRNPMAGSNRFCSFLAPPASRRRSPGPAGSSRAANRPRISRQFDGKMNSALASREKIQYTID